MRVLITGATGMIGKEVIAKCHESNIKVNYLTTNKDKLNLLSECEGFYWDPKNGIIDERCFDNVEVIVNLVGATVAKRWTSSYKNEILASRVQTAKLIAKTLKKRKHIVRHLISASAIGIYQDSFRNYYYEDAQEFDDGFLGEVVKQWEASTSDFKAMHIEVSILRIGIVLSNKGGAFPKMLKPIQHGFGAVFGHGKQWQSWIHIEDLASIFLFVLKEEAYGVFNAVAPNPVSNKTLTYTIADYLGKEIVMPNLPRKVMKILFGEMHILLFTSQRVCSKKIIDAGFDFKFRNIKKAVENIIN